MKSIFVVLAMTVASLAVADEVKVACYDMTNGSIGLLLRIEEGRLFSIELGNNQGGFGFDELVTLLPGQGNSEQLVYSVAGQTDLLTIDKSILSTQSGGAQLGFNNFNCAN